MANTTILLREDVEALGGRGEIVKVKAGYARNYLLPQGLATLATKGNVKQIEGERAALLKKAAEEKATAELQKDQMGVIELAFERKAGEGGTLFGSVTSMDIADALQAKGYEIDRRKIVLRDPIKETGEYSVNVKLHREVVLEIPIKVTPEGGEIVEAKSEKKAKKAKDEETLAPAEPAAAEEAADVVEADAEAEAEAEANEA
jgi:large subunit ribosomal protein L9